MQAAFPLTSVVTEHGLTLWGPGQVTPPGFSSVKCPVKLGPFCFYLLKDGVGRKSPHSLKDDSGNRGIGVGVRLSLPPPLGLCLTQPAAVASRLLGAALWLEDIGDHQFSAGGGNNSTCIYYMPTVCMHSAKYFTCTSPVIVPGGPGEGLQLYKL